MSLTCFHKKPNFLGYCKNTLLLLGGGDTVCPGMEKNIFFIILDFHLNHTYKNSGYPHEYAKKIIQKY